MADFLDIAYPANAIFELRLYSQLHGQQCINTWHYQNQGGSGANLGSDLNNWMNDFYTEIWLPLRGLLSQELINAQLTMQMVHPTRYRALFYTSMIQNAGTVADESLPSGVTVVARRQGNLADRHNQGRVYIPGIPVGSEEDSRLAAAVIAGWDDWVKDDMALPLNGGASQQAVNILCRPDYTAPQTVTQTVLDTILRYQRRREIGVGK